MTDARDCANRQEWNQWIARLSMSKGGYDCHVEVDWGAREWLELK